MHKTDNRAKLAGRAVLVSGINNLGCGGNNLECLLKHLVEEADNLSAGAGWRYGFFLGGRGAPAPGVAGTVHVVGICDVALTPR